MHLFFNLISIWAYSSVGSAKGSVFCHIYNFILLYSSVPLLELLIWARSSVWESVRFASICRHIPRLWFPSNLAVRFPGLSSQN